MDRNMTTSAMVSISVKCINPYCSWFGKPMGTIDVSRETLSIVDTRQCWKCKVTHRQTLRIG